jgi:hypothetical protein
MRGYALLELALVSCGLPAADERGALSATGNDSAFVSQRVPSALLAGEPFTVTVTMRNTGTTTWSEAGAYHLGSQDPEDNTNFGTGRAVLDPGVTVAPGEDATFTFELTAPTVPGTYSFQWQMVQEGVEWFGAFSPATPIAVSLAPPRYLAPDGDVLAPFVHLVTLHWSEVPAASSYDVAVADTTAGTVQAFPGVTATEQTVAVVAGHDYSWSVAARDGGGLVSGPATAAFSVRAAVPDTTPPTVSIPHPAAGARVSGRALVSAVADDDVDVRRATLWVDGRLRGILEEPPWLFAWDSRLSPNGAHIVTVVVDDDAHNRAAASVAVTVDNRELGPCIPPGDGSVGDEVAITAALDAPGKVALLCPGATYHLHDQVLVQFADADIHTQGFPVGAGRARLVVDGGPRSGAIQGVAVSGVSIRNVEIDGNRATVAAVGGDALVVLGGNGRDIFLDHVKAHDTRTWSTLHLFEGNPFKPAKGCGRALVVDNEFGPAGFPGGQWADGISLACRDSRVMLNVIRDATDGAIVIFGAPGSLVAANFIVAESRELLGGINMVDFAPFDGDYRGTVVVANVIAAVGAPIKIANAMGLPVWGCVFDDAHRNFGAKVVGNLLLGSFMHYGFVANGVADWTVVGNVSLATHAGVPEAACGFPAPSAPAPFLKDARHAGWTFQPEFVDGQVDALLGVHF